MAVGVWTDSGGTTAVANPLIATVDINGTNETDVQLYFGEQGSTLQAASDPGTDQITLSITDTLGTGSLKLALTQGGLDSATAGASLDLGTSVGTSVKEFWVRVENTATTRGDYTGLSFTHNDVF